MGASIEKPCLQISARRNGTLDPSLTKHSKTKISNTKRSPASTLRPCARRGECISYHGGHAAQTNYYICVGKIWKVYAGFYSHRFHGRKTFQDRGASLGYSEIPHVNMCLARPKFRDDQNLGML